MPLDTSNLPDDPEQLRELVKYLVKRVNRAEQQAQELRAEQQRRRKPTTEESADQRLLFEQMLAEAQETSRKGEDAGSEEDEQSDDEGNEEEPASRPPRPRGKRSPLPEHLPRETQRIEIDEDDPRRKCPCCNGWLVEIGQDVTEQLEWQPAVFKVNRLEQVKYGCKDCEATVLRSDKPPQPIEKGIPGPGLLAQVATNRFQDHLPYYRQAESFARFGVELSRGTLSRWMARAADLLEPIVLFMFEAILDSRRIHVDDTKLPVIEVGRGEVLDAKIWAYLGDEDHAHTVFDVTRSRSRDGPATVLANYKGFLQADACNVYDEIYADGKIVEVACWAHARQKFVDARDHDLRAHEVIVLIGELYAVEERGRKLTEAGRLALRQEESEPILEKIHNWVMRHQGVLRPKSVLAVARRYLVNQWEALTRFAKTGFLEPDNNAAERALRRVAVGRKNWLFAGNMAAAKRAAVIISLVESCRRNDVDCFEYLRDVLDRVSVHPQSRIEELTPAGWKAARLAEREQAMAEVAVETSR